jgi:hypothetical protein
MKLQIGDSEVVFYDDIHTLPNIRRFISNEYAVWSSEVGNSISKSQESITNAYAYIAAGKIKEGLIHLQNADMALEALKQEEDFDLKELCCYLKSINGEVVELTKERVEYFAELLNDTGITSEQVEEALLYVKKKRTLN